MKIQEVEEVIEALESSDKFNEKTKIASVGKKEGKTKVCVADDGWYLFFEGKLHRTGNTVVNQGITIRDLERIVDAYVRDIGPISFYTLNTIDLSYPFFDKGRTIFYWDREKDIMRAK